MNNLLDDKEYKTLQEAHKEFDKTCFGKRFNRLKVVFPILFCIFLFLGIVCSVANSFGLNNGDIYGAICFGVSFINVPLSILATLLYENMVMNYANKNN